MSDSTSVEQVDAFLRAQNELEEFIPVEYKVIEIHSLTGTADAGTLEDSLNKLGSEGWELVVWDGSRAIFMRS